jgi:type VI protein secretion system component VasK
MILTGIAIIMVGSMVPMMLWYMKQITWRLMAVVSSVAFTVGGVVMGILDFWPFWVEVLFWTYIGASNLGTLLWVGYRRPPQWEERGLRW